MAEFFKWLYAQMLKLYPANFRRTFADEMQDVFGQAANECAHPGKVLKIFVRELKDWPTSLLREHWDAVRKEVSLVNSLIGTLLASEDETPPGSWGAAVLAGLPHFFTGCLLAAGNLLLIAPSQNSAIFARVLRVGLGFVILGMLVAAWRRGWPLWSASWYLYGVLFVAAILSLGVEALPIDESWRISNAIWFGWVGFSILGYFTLLMKSRLHGLLSVAFFIPLLSIMLLEFIPDPVEGIFGISTGLLAALAAGAIVRAGSTRLALALVPGLYVLTGIAWAYVGEYWAIDLPAGVPPGAPQLSEFLLLLVVYITFSLAILALPFFLRSLWQAGRRRFGG